MNSRIFFYLAIIISLFIHPVLTILILLCAVFFVHAFYESILVALAIDVWFAGGISYATILTAVCILVLYTARPYIRV